MAELSVRFPAKNRIRRTASHGERNSEKINPIGRDGRPGRSLTVSISELLKDKRLSALFRTAFAV